MKRPTTYLLIVIWLFALVRINAQEKKEEDHAYKPLTLKLNDDGSKYIRFLFWHQVWLTTNNLSAENDKLQLSTSIRRSRFLAYTQISPKFLLLTHWGLNGLSTGNLTSLGNNDDAPQLFLHGAWGEVQLSDAIYIGAGLHYWNGPTRLASQSTLNFLTLDQSRPFVHWHSIGITDQFARHLGIYLKGSSGKFEYRFAVNNPGRNGLGGGTDYGAQSSLTYNGMNVPDQDGDPTGNTIISGYIKYNLWENESVKLPYYVGSYLGTKKVLALGGGFFLHPNGMYDTQTGTHEGVSHFALDAFMEYPTDGGSLTAYASFMKYNYGEDYISRWAGTGATMYAQAGYYIKSAKIQPYFSYSSSDFDGAPETISALDIGFNYFINGHHAKISAEYHRINNDFREGAIDLTAGRDALSQLRFQLHVFL